MNHAQLHDIATRYTAAWCGGNAAAVAAFFSPAGSLTINGGEAAVGRDAIGAAVQGFMTAFPDLVVAMDKVEQTGARITYHWTLSGTNTGPGGTGKAVRVSGHEKWRLDEGGKIAESTGTFDAADYERQLAAGLPFDLRGRIALVTGGNGGIGRAIALGLARAGAGVAVLGRNEQKNAKVADELKAIGVASAVFQVDVTKRATLGQAMADVERTLGSVDILVNNAGVVFVTGGVLHETEETWDTTLDTHLNATFLLSKLAAESMVKRRRGKIINIASIYSIFGAGLLPAYSAAKGAIVQLTKSMAIELAPHNIQVNAIAPGWIETDMTAPAWNNPDANWKAFNQLILDRTPSHRWGKPDETAGAAVFLASQAADFITGVTLPVDGGYSIA